MSTTCICCGLFFLPQVIFLFLLLLGMVLYANVLREKINYNIYINIKAYYVTGQI